MALASAIFTVMPVTTSLLLLALITAVSLAGLQKPAIQQALILEPARVARGERLYTLLTSGFIHADLGHLFLNLFTLYFFAGFIENYYEMVLGLTAWPLVALFLSGVVIANLPSLYRHRKDGYYQTLGASGGVSAVVFAAILLEPTQNICLYFVLCLPAAIMGVAYLAYSYYQSRQGRSHINHEAHFAGALWGLAYQTLLSPDAWRRALERVF